MTPARPTVDVDGLKFIKALVNAWDCCGTCAGGVLARRDQALLAAVTAERDEARAAVWDEGYRSGFSNAMRRMSDEPNAPTTPNPYGAAALDHVPTTEGGEG